jgi:hypothetical protein
MACLLARPLTTVKDPLSGFFATRRSAILDCEGNARGFKIALELIVTAKNGSRVREIPVVFRDRVRGQSKMQLRVLLIYLARLTSLFLEHTLHDFRIHARSLTAVFRSIPAQRSEAAQPPPLMEKATPGK